MIKLLSSKNYIWSNKYNFFSKWLAAAVTLVILVQYGCKDNVTNIVIEESKIWNGQVISDVVCAVIKPDSTVWAWGFNGCGTLGNGTNTSSDYPVKVLKLSSIVAIDSYWGAAYAADKAGNIWFWGNNAAYLGPPNSDTNVTIPIKIASLNNITSISTWGNIVNFLTNDGSVWHLKMDYYSPKVIEGPTQYSGIGNIIAIHKFNALRSDGKIYKLISGDYLPNVPENITSIQYTSDRNVVLKNDGTVWAWGSNALGQLGDGTYIDRNIPVQVKNLLNIKTISSNYDYNLALGKDGSVWFWGYSGKQGDSLTAVNTPVKIEGLQNIVLIYAEANNLVMKEDGTYWTFNVSDKIPKQVKFN
jgi:alpha-tubulin suppressor-like RCC1 family protein